MSRLRFEQLPDGTTRAFREPEPKPDPGPRCASISPTSGARCEMLEHPPEVQHLNGDRLGFPELWSTPVPRLVEYRIRFEMPARTVTNLEADDALEQADKLMHNELTRLAESCPALAGYKLTIEHVDD